MAKKKRPRRTFVLDGSIALAWFFEDETDDYAAAVENAMTSSTAIVPSLWWLEVANALLVGERRKRTTEAKVATFLSLLRQLPIVTDEETALRAWQETLMLARTHQLSVYDAAYLELARRRGLSLASLDRPLKLAATAIGIAEFQP